MKQRFQSEHEKAVHNEGVATEACKALNAEKQVSAELRDQIDAIDETLQQTRSAAETLNHLLTEQRAATDEAQRRAASAEQLVTELKAKLYDYMSDGLTFNSDSLVVYTDANKSNTLAASNYTVSSNAHSFTITFTNIISTISTNSLTSADKFYVYYDATLNENAKVYTEGHNDNTAYLVYSNNPYDGGTGESPHVTVYDWTFTMALQTIPSAAM